MSFDIFLQRFIDGKSAEADRNPIRKVLASTTYRSHNNSGLYIIEFPDGVAVEFSAGGLESTETFTGCSFQIRHFSNHVMDLIFEIARAGNMVIFPAMEGNPLILVTDEQGLDVPAKLMERFQTVVVHSGDELAVLLVDGLESWTEYRDQIVGDSLSEDEAKQI